jgi:hypothetical protein
VIETTGSILGLAHWDGTLYLDRECILDPLQRMYELAGEEQPIPMLVRYRESLATLLHEQVHFLGPAGASQDAARDAFTQPGGRQLEEGVAEAWAQDNLDDYLTRLGVDKVAPGIKDVQAGGYYSAFVPAVRRLTTDLEARNDLRPGQVLDVLNRETAAGQFPLLVSLVYNSTRLPELEPAGADTRRHLEAILRAGLAHLDTFELHPPSLAAAKSHSTAGELLQHLHHEIQSAESAYTFHPTACALPSPTRTSPPTRLALPSPSTPAPSTPATTSPTPAPAPRTPPPANDGARPAPSPAAGTSTSPAPAQLHRTVPPPSLAVAAPSSVGHPHGAAHPVPHAFQAALSGISPPRPNTISASTTQTTGPPTASGVPAQLRSAGSRGRHSGVGMTP